MQHQHQKGTQSSYDYIISIANDKTSFYTRFAFLCSYNKPYPYWIGGTLLFIEYIQLIAQALVLDSDLFSNPGPEEAFLYNLILRFVQLSNPFFYLSNEISFPYYIVLFSLMLCYFTCKFALFLYIMAVAAKRVREIAILRCLWAWTYKMQGRVMYILSTSFLVRTFKILALNRSDFAVFNNSGVRAVCIFIITTEFSLSIILQVWVTYILPTKDFLARKDYKIEVITLAQKFGVQIMRTLVVLNFPENSLAVAWICTSINTIVSCIRVRWCLITLPYYKFSALYCLVGLTISVACLHFAFSVKTFIKTCSPDDDIGLNFPIVVWIILTCLTLKIAFTWIKTTLTRLITVKLQNVCPQLLIHKPIIIKEIRQLNEVPAHPVTQNASWMYLLNTAIASKIKTALEILNIQSVDSEEFSEEFKAITRVYLESLLRRFPQNSLIGLYAGNFYIKKLKLYGFGMKILARLQKSSSYQASFNASLLIYELQCFLQNEYENKKSLMDLSTYLKSLKVVAQLKKKICFQAELQTKMYREMRVRSPDLNKIIQCGLEIHAFRNKVQNHIKKVLEITPDLYTEPLLICANYYLTLNHWPDEYLKCMRTLQQRRYRLDKAFAADMFSEENLYQSSNGIVLYSGLDGAEGKASYTRGIKEIYGRDLLSNHISTLGMPCLQPIFHEMATNLLAKGKNDMLQMNDTFGYHSEGYIFPLNFYMNICPSLDHGLYYFSIIRKKPVGNKDFIVINEQGDIEGFSKDIGIKLGLFNSNKRGNARKLIPISTISRDLCRINKAYNMIALPEKYKTTAEDREEAATDDDFNGFTGFDLQSKHSDRETKNRSYVFHMEKSRSFKSKTLSFEDAQKIVSLLTSKGANIEFNKLKELNQSNMSFNPQDETFTYNCTVENQYFGTLFLKKITLEQVKSNKGDSDQSDIGRGIVKEAWKTPVHHNNLKGDIRPPHSQADDFVSFMTDDEKELGWIDLKKIEQNDHNDQKDTSPLQQSPTRIVLEDNQISADRDIPSTSRKLLLNKHTFPTLMAETPHKKPKEEDELKVITIAPNKPSKKMPDGAKVKGKLSFGGGGGFEEASSAQRSQSTQLKVIRAFKESEFVKFYPRFYRVFFFILYGVMLSIVINQSLLKSSLDTDVNSLKSKKDVLSTAESRNFILLNIHRRTRTLWNFATGRQNEADYAANAKAAVILGLLATDVENLIAANSELVNAATALEESNIQKLFQSDVRVYDIDSDADGTHDNYTNLTNFQATASIIETCLKAFSVAKTDLNASVLDFEMILYNSINDLLIESENAADIFLQSLDDQRTTTIKNLNQNLVIILSPLTTVVIAFGVIIFLQHRSDKRNMMAFLKIDSKSVDIISERISNLKKALLEDTHFEQNSEIFISDYYYNYNHETDSPLGKAVKHQFQTPNKKALAIKYYFYSARLLLFVAMIIGLIFVFYSEMKKVTNNLNTTLTQLHYSDRMNSLFCLAITTSLDLPSTNGSALIENILASDELAAGIQDIITIQNTIPDLFKKPDGTYDAVIENILFGNACFYVTGLFAPDCEEIKQNASNAGFIRFLSLFENLLTDFDQRFESSNRTTEALSAFTFEAFNQFALPANPMFTLAELISDTFHSDFDQILNNGEKESTILSVMIYLLLLAIYNLIYFCVVVQIREAENHFKRILQLFPANLVLSNFVLKSYLLRTSGSAFESIRSEL